MGLAVRARIMGDVALIMDGVGVRKSIVGLLLGANRNGESAPHLVNLGPCEGCEELKGK